MRGALYTPQPQLRSCIGGRGSRGALLASAWPGTAIAPPALEIRHAASLAPCLANSTLDARQVAVQRGFAAAVAAGVLRYSVQRRAAVPGEVAAEDTEATERRPQRPPALIIGGGRIGTALYEMGKGRDVIMGRNDSSPPFEEGPIYVCTRNDALKGIIESVPKERHEDLVFVQNGALLPFLEKELGPGVNATVVLVYFAVPKKGEAPVDGKTDLDPDGLTAVNVSGKWVGDVSWRLYRGNLSCRVLAEPSFTQAYWEKLLWISAYMLVGTLHGNCTVGVVESEHREEVDALIGEMACAVTADNPDMRWDRRFLCDRLAAYARSVADFPTAVKEFEWRNGAFYNISLKALAAGRPDPCPRHTEGLRKVGALPKS